MSDSKPNTPTQAARRTMYGLNVAIAAVVVVALVVALNWLIAYTYDRVDGPAKRWVRYDLTATRAYSLSPQTLNLLGSLEEDRRIVTLFRSNSAALERVRDLIDEYARYSSRVTVDHINPDFDAVDRDAFFNELHDKYEADVAPAREAIEPALDAMSRLQATFAQMEGALTPLLEDGSLPRNRTWEALRALSANSPQRRAVIEAEQGLYRAELEQPLPGYDEVTRGLTATLAENDQFLSTAAEFFVRASDQAGAPIAVKEALLRSAEDFRAAQAKLSDAIDPLGQLTTAEDYESARATLLSQESVALLSPGSARIIPISEMFREPDPQMVEETGNPEPPFIGEERLTGALVSLGLKHPPLLVLLSASGGSAAQRGVFSYVADRAQAANFEVRTWDAQGTPTPYGAPLPPGEVPQPLDGQAVVYVVAPTLPSPNPQQMVAMAGFKQSLADAVEAQLDAGHAVMAVPFPDFAMNFGVEDPLITLLQNRLGIKPMLDRLIVHEMAGRDGNPAADNSFAVDSWPDDLPIGRAMRGHPTLVTMSSPLKLETKPGITHYPLLVLERPRMWSIADATTTQDIMEAKYDPETSAEAFTVGVAAKTPEQRVIVIADPSWPMDNLTTFGYDPLRNQTGPGAALGHFGVAHFPGNTELFLNCVYWLAELDEMIAASARSQDIRRVRDIGDGEMTGYRLGLLVGMPAAALFVGLGVWFLRRRG